MLGFRPIASEPLLAPPAGEVEPYEIDLDRETELDFVHLIVWLPFIDAE
jgi:hypothetical protein